MAEIINFIDRSAEFERDKEVWQLLLAFLTPRKIAERLNISIDEVHKSQARMSGGVTPDFRSRQMQLMLDQVGELQQTFYIRARKGDQDAANFQLRAHDFKARLLGLYAPPMREDPMEEVKSRRLTTTEEISSIIDEIRGITDGTIDGEVVASEDVPAKDDEPTPEGE